MSLLNLPAPEFTLPANTGENISLENFRGKNVVLVFYPLDFSPVCNIQLPEFSSRQDEFLALNTKVLGINRDSVWTHKAWAHEYGIKVPLLADMNLETAKAYGVALDERGISKRATFLINTSGTVVLEHVEAETKDFSLRPDELIEKIEALTKI